MGTSPPDRVVVDTNVYLRLGRDLVPLFGHPWGPPPGLLFVVHGATKEEYFHNPRLRSKFDWVADEPHLGDLLSGKVKLRQSQKDAVADTLEYLKDHVVSQRLSCSEVDQRCLATAIELRAPLATDDGDLQTLARAFGHEVISTLGLLSLLLGRECIDRDTVKRVAARWVRERDLPRNFRAEFVALFGEEAP